MTDQNETEYFYHSFPRHFEHDPDFALGLGTLGSILKNGLLLTAERYPQTGKFPHVDFIQQRACFTSAVPSALKAHAVAFGKFSIEFKGDALRAFGVQPAFYLAGSRPGVLGFNEVGGELAFFLSEITALLWNLYQLRGNQQPEDLKKAVGAVMAQAFHERYEFQRLFYTAQALMHLYYHTDKPDGEALHFFQQREWKIIPCFAFGGDPFPYRSLSEEERNELLALNERFFSADVLGRRRVDECLYFKAVGKKPIVDDIHRIIVPNDDIATRAHELVKAAGLTIPVATLESLPSPTQQPAASAP